MMMRRTMIKMQSIHPNGRSLAALLLITSILTCGARSQRDAPQAGPGAGSQPAASISTGQALYLVRSTLLTLNDANRTGNYTVLRELAAPDFQARNTASDLAQIFADLRRRNFDLLSVALIAPQFTSAPALVDAASGKLRLTGFFATQPLRINFDLAFQSVGGQWRLFAISIATPDAPVEQSRLGPRPPQRRPRLFHDVRLFSGMAGLQW
jgi:hypothetical protein